MQLRGGGRRGREGLPRKEGMGIPAIYWWIGMVGMVGVPKNGGEERGADAALPSRTAGGEVLVFSGRSDMSFLIALSIIHLEVEEVSPLLSSPRLLLYVACMNLPLLLEGILYWVWVFED